MRVLVSLSLFLVWWMILNMVLSVSGAVYDNNTVVVAFLGAIPTTIVSIYLFRHFRLKRGEVQ